MNNYFSIEPPKRLVQNRERKKKKTLTKLLTWNCINLATAQLLSYSLYHSAGETGQKEENDQLGYRYRVFESLTHLVAFFSVCLPLLLMFYCECLFNFHVEPFVPFNEFNSKCIQCSPFSSAFARIFFFWFLLLLCFCCAIELELFKINIHTTNWWFSFYFSFISFSFSTLVNYL